MQFEIDRIFNRPEISILECRMILEKNGEKYTDDEIKNIRALLLFFVEIEFSIYEAIKRDQIDSKVVSISKKVPPNNKKDAA